MAREELRSGCKMQLEGSFLFTRNTGGLPVGAICAGVAGRKGRTGW